MSGPVGLLVSQTLIVFLMIFSFLFLGTRYRLFHFIGAFLVIAAVVVSLIPSFESGLELKSEIALIVLIFQPLPYVFSQLGTQYLLKLGRVDVFDCLLIITLFHSLYNVPAILLIPFLQVDIPFSNITANARDGFICLFGRENLNIDDNCTYAIAWYSGFFVSIFGVSLISLMIQQRLSATSCNIAGTAALPVSSFLFLINVFGGFAFTLYLPLSLVIVVAGLLIYFLTPEREGRPILCPRKQQSFTDIAD